MTDYVILLTTLPDEAQAHGLASALVEAKLAGCVQVVGPIFSVYRWLGAVESAQEWLCLVKTHSALTERVTEAILARHPYDTPEVVAIPIVGGSERYLAWLAKALGHDACGSGK